MACTAGCLIMEFRYLTPRETSSDSLAPVDITERKYAEQALQASETRYRTLFETTREGVLIVDGEGRYVDVNESFCRLMKSTRDRTRWERVFRSSIPAGRLEEATLGLAQLKAGGAGPADFPLQALDGTILDLEWTSSSHSCRGSRVAPVATLRSEGAPSGRFESREEEFRTLLAALPDIVSRFDRDLRFVYMSPAVQRSTVCLLEDGLLGKTHIEPRLPEELSTSYGQV